MPFFSGVGMSISGQYPPSNAGVAFVTITASGATYTNDLGTVFVAAQRIVDPSVTGGSSPNYGFNLVTQGQGGIVGDGNVYLYSAFFRVGGTGATNQSYGAGQLELNPITISNLAIVNAGSAALAAVCIGVHTDGGGPLDQATAGGIGSGTVTVTFPKNATITAPATLDFNNLPTLAVSSSPCGTTGFTWGIESGALPAGLSLNASTGAITGTPTTSGAYTVTIFGQKVSGSSYCWGDATISGVVWVPTGIGLQISGSNIDDTSGVYFFDPTMLHDRLYSRFFGVPKDVNIPNPSISTGYIGG